MSLILTTLDKMAGITQADLINESIREAVPHRLVSLPTMPTHYRPVARRLHVLGNRWWRQVSFTHLYYNN